MTVDERTALSMSIMDVVQIIYFKVISLVPSDITEQIQVFNTNIKDVFKNSDDNLNLHLILEAVLFIGLAFVLFTPRKRKATSGETITEKEIDMMVREYKPLPLYTGEDSKLKIQDIDVR